MHFDYIFSGAGLAGLMTLIKMADNGLLANKDVIIFEPNDKLGNDRTWCFWEKSTGNWDKLLSHHWGKSIFINDYKKIECLKDEYIYKMIESQTFYNYAKEKLKNYNILWIKEKVISFEEFEDIVIVKTEMSTYSGTVLFNSVLDLNKIQNNAKFPLLQQHFIGWFVKTDEPAFSPTEATFMDFSVDQKGNTRFMYVLPKSETEALVEYTLFSPNLLTQKEYEEAIISYLKLKGINRYKIEASENGNIPMTNLPVLESNTKRILNIGSVGGWTKRVQVTLLKM